MLFQTGLSHIFPEKLIQIKRSFYFANAENHILVILVESGL